MARLQKKSLIFIFLGEGFTYFCCIATRAKGVKPLLVAATPETPTKASKHQQRLQKIVSLIPYY